MSEPRDDHREIEAFLSGYFAAFVAGEYDRIAGEMYRVPVVMTSDEGVRVLGSPAEIEGMFKSAAAALAADGYANSELLETKISVLNQTTALAATRFRRVRQDGSLIVEAGATYTLLCEGGQWRVSAAALHDTECLVSLG